MELYEVKIEERLVKIVRKEAESAQEAEREVKKKWLGSDDENYILSADDFLDVSFTARLCKAESTPENE